MGWNYSGNNDSNLDQGQAIKAWRCWKVNRDGYLLGIGVDLRWRPGEKNIAVHKDVPYEIEIPHEAPKHNCPCGFWGLNSIYRLKIVYQTSFVFGTVSLWGRVIECEFGWRAQYAYPDVIYVPEYRSNYASRIRELYKVDVVSCNLSNLEGLLKLQQQAQESAA